MARTFINREIVLPPGLDSSLIIIPDARQIQILQSVVHCRTSFCTPTCSNSELRRSPVPIARSGSEKDSIFQLRRRNSSGGAAARSLEGGASGQGGNRQGRAGGGGGVGHELDEEVGGCGGAE